MHLNTQLPVLSVSGIIRKTFFLLLCAALVFAPVLSAVADDEETPPPPVVSPISVGDTIFNPVTGENEIVIDINGPEVVYTDKGNIILRTTQTGMLFEQTIEDENEQTVTTLYTIGQTFTNANGHVDRVELIDSEGNKSVIDVVQKDPSDTSGNNGDQGMGSDPLDDFPNATGDKNMHTVLRVGSRGKNGSHGGGIRICIFRCFTIGKNPGKGGDGAHGPNVTHVINTTQPNIETISNARPGIVVSSIGGDGGNGGNGWGVNIKGAAGGRAGNGGNVTLDNAVNVTTSGEDSHAIFVQSRSGKGGTGGSGYIASGGATGGAAGEGGRVDVINRGVLTTHGKGAAGIMAQSLGGAAGSGGDSFGIVGDAGSGSLGGHGGSVFVDNYGHINTSGNDAYGIFAQSIGGSGGNAGDAGGIVSFGESGEAGGNAGAVSVTAHDTSEILTLGHGSHGIFVQSIGGGGGSGGYAKGVAGLGSSGGFGGDGGNVSIENHGLIETYGNFARAIFGQSIGGGGGSGGDGGGLVSIGGSGGAASSSGNVILKNTGTIITRGAKSDAIFAQSIGGGGGDGGSSGGAFLSIGGSGAAGGDSGNVRIEHSGYIRTEGNDSRGIFAQAVGGGGGSGGSSTSVSAFAGVAIGGSGGEGGQGGNASVVFSQYEGEDGNWYNPTLITQGDRAIGVIVQSVGGGGGSGGYAVQSSVGYGASMSVSLGGSGGKGGDGGTASLNGFLSVLTTNDFSDAIFVQSVGGGGGNGGMSMSYSFAVGETAAAAMALAMGGEGGEGGDGGSVTINSGGNIVTEGEFSKGLVAQSIGGGGGNGGFSVAFSGAGAGAASAAVAVGIGGSGGKGGDGKSVNVNFDGTILTKNNHSTGALIQSVGGGGGSGGMNISGAAAFAGKASGAITVGLGGSGGDGGQGGNITGLIGDDIITLGDYSTGALFQSVGGGGGSGGMNISGSLGGSGGVSGSAAIGIGGSGGGGGTGGNVDATASFIRTRGFQSVAFLAQSVGGGGGAGGINISGSINASKDGGGAIAVGIGGFGGGGGDAGNVVAHSTDDVITEGDLSRAVIVQSVGGGGGAGGMNVSGAVSLSAGTGVSVGVGIGGFGGLGGDGSDVYLSRIGDTLTTGLMSDAITVQSVGGGGGAGGTNITGTVALSTDSGTSVGFGLGGFGGDGGDAGKAEANIIGSAITEGVDIEELFNDEGDLINRLYKNGSSAVIVQSVGGSGGNGGMNVSGSLAFAPPSGGGSNSIGIGIGGFGGGGGHAQQAKLTLKGTPDDRSVISSIGDYQSSVLVQSVGGGGGHGGINISGAVALDGVAAIGIGGFGGAGGMGRNVDADIDADIYALGNYARGVLAQSIGGGGGNGGINISGSISGNLQDSAPTLAFGLGGFGGAGNTSGDVTVAHNGLIMVEGIGSAGMLAQSVGGGGGSGALNVSATGSAGSEGSYSVGVGIGGNGGTGADAGDVAVNSTGDVIVNGRLDSNNELVATEFTGDAVGILVQSIGGGGGNGGVNVSGVITRSSNPFVAGVGGSGGASGDGATVSFARGFVLDENNDEQMQMGQVVTFGDQSDGIIIQSIGGGGGRAGLNLAFAGSKSSDYAGMLTVGGNGGGGGHGGLVNARHAGHIFTHGDGSNGLIAQSIGGGGGNTNMNIGLGYLKDSSALAIGIGGDPASAGDGGNVFLEHWGNIVTMGKNAVAVLAQSIGGGGGNATSNKTTALKTSHQLAVSIGREGGAGGTGGDVELLANGMMMTEGDESTAVMAQSIGGGGGTSSTTSVSATSNNENEKTSHQARLQIGLDGGAGAHAGNVTVETDGLISTKGRDSRGIFAQSIGGGGGVAGSVSISNTKGATTDLGLALGGNGGTGAKAGWVEILNQAMIETMGDNSDAIFAQSIGGGGGVAGSISEKSMLKGDNVSDKNSVKFSAYLGGDGGVGAEGDNVRVENSGLIMTYGEKSFGIRAQSIGGGGGVGGSIQTMTLQNTSSQQAMEIGIGGSGGDGAKAGDVTVTNDGGIITFGTGAVAIAANSIGGGGGDAGLVSRITAGKTNDKEVHRFALNIGGSGGDGGAGGNVSVSNLTGGTSPFAGEIITSGDDAYGIFAQSLGGGGGNGSAILSATALISGQDSASIGLNIGGNGGTGHIGGAISVLNEGLIETSGKNAHAIIAQSIGGGGGNGGFVLAGNALIGQDMTTPMISVGGSGGDGGNGGIVTVTNSGSIVTRGEQAHGIIAQSIGGGGGNAGMAVTASNDIGASVLSNGLALALGAISSGDGGTGGAVTVNHSGDISVFGKGSQAIIAQSINGGGGNLSLDLDKIATILGLSDQDEATGQTQNPVIALYSGAHDVSDMNAGNVTLNLTGTFGAAGDYGAGSQSQVIGGGGGTTHVTIDMVDAPDDEQSVPVNIDVVLGGENGQRNSGGEISATHNGAIMTDGIGTYGVFEQSIGGGGGRTVVDVTLAENTSLGQVNVTLGGKNGQQESGGLIQRHQQDFVLTTGNYAAGSVWQSIGGGGGVVDLSLANSGGGMANGTMLLGAQGGQDLHGGDIENTLDGIIATGGDYASAVIAQSIGGGGGYIMQAGQAFFDTSFGGTSGAQGDGGDITIDSNDIIVSQGLASHGVFLQSVGGGGGAVFGENSMPFAMLNSDNTGSGGHIDFSQQGGVSVSGDNAYGVIAQTLGGGGGWMDGGFSGQSGGIGQGGNITLQFSDDVVASGQNAVGIFAQSLGLDASGNADQGNIHITTNGMVRGGAGQGAAIILDGGATNILDISGNVSSASGQAIRTGAGDETIYSSGIITGNIDLGGGHNTLVNGHGADFTSYDTLQLHNQDGNSSGVFVNNGNFTIGLSASIMPATSVDNASSSMSSFGGFSLFSTFGPAPDYVAAVVTTTNIVGDFVQGAAGHMDFDVSFGPYPSDRMIVTDDVELAGTGTVRLLWLEDLQPVTLIEVGGQFTDNGFAFNDTLGLRYNLLSGSGGVQVQAQSDFAQPFMNENQNALARHMDSALALGDAQGVGRVLAYLGNLGSGNEELYSSIFDQMNPEPYVAPMVMHLSTANHFSQNMYNCNPIWQRQNDDCARFSVGHSSLTRDATSENYAMKGNTTDFTGSFEKSLDKEWSVLGALGFSNLHNMHVDNNRARVKGNGVNAGVGVRWAEEGGYDVSLSLVGGWNWLDASRNVNVFGAERGEASYQTQFARTGLRMGQKWMVGDTFFARAGIDFAATGLRQGSFTEKGLDSMNIKGESHTSLVGTIAPELTFGTIFENTEMLSSTGSVTFGVIHNSKDQIRMPYRFSDTNAAAQEAMIGTAIDRNAFKIDGNFDLWSNRQFGAQLNLRHIAGQDISDTSANFRIKARF